MRYAAKPIRVLAIQLNMPITYEKWGGTQNAKAGDWMLSKAGNTYTCEDEVFQSTYKSLPEDGWYYKEAFIDAKPAATAGTVDTLEGQSAYEAGDYIVTNPGGDRYCIPKMKFKQLYEPA